MVAIVTGSGLGIERSAANMPGSRGQIGSAVTGRANESVVVNAANGNLILSNRDELLIGRGPDSEINRTYNSLGLFNDDNGDNWRMSTHRRVFGLVGALNTVGSTVRRTDWDGSETVYTWDAGRSAYVSKNLSGAYDTITRANTTSTTPWIWTDGDSQFSETYDDSKSGRITSRRDAERDGSNNPTNVITYTYDASGKLTSVATADGNYTNFTWSGVNMVMLTTTYTDTQTSTQKSLIRTRYAYDTSNRLTTVWTDLSPEDNSIADGRVYTTSYTYDGTSKRVASIAQTDGSFVSFTYVLVDGACRVASVSQTVETGVIRTTSFAYNTAASGATAGTTTITDPVGVVTTLSYDSAGNLIRQTVLPVSGGNEQITTYSYVGNGMPVRNLMIRSETLDSANWGKVTATVVANDPARPAPNGGGNTAEKITFGATGGKLTQNSLNTVYGVRYIADIWVYSDTATTVSWGIVENSNIPDTYSVAAATWTRLRAYGTYSTSASLRRVELAGGSNQVIWATQSQVRLETDPDQYVATIGAAVTSTTLFGSSDDIATIRRFDGAANESAGNWIEREDFTYDAYGNLIRRVDGAGKTVEYSYNWANQRLTETVYLTADPDGVAGVGVASNPVITRYVYDSEQHLRFEISPEGRVTEYLYDGSAQRLSTSVNGAGQLTRTVQYNNALYTAAGQPTEAQMMDWRSTANMPYKVDSLVTETSYDFRGNIATTTTYGIVDSNGDNVVAWNYGSHSSTHYVYDQFGQLLKTIVSGRNEDGSTFTSATETYAYDGMGRVVRHTDALGVGTWTSYIDAQNRTVTTLASGLTTTQVYNRAGELVSSIEARGGIGSEIALPLTSWLPSGATMQSSGTLDGAPATLFTVAGPQSGQSQSGYMGFAAAEGETYSGTISLQATASSSSVLFGIYGSNTGWGPANIATARIISGPGLLEQWSGGSWKITGLSSTEPTRIEVTRTFLQSEPAYLLLYPDYPAGSVVGRSILASAPSLVLSRYDTSVNGGSFALADFNLNGVQAWGMQAPTATTLNDLPANIYTLTTPPQGDLQGMRLASYNANAGDTFTHTILLQGSSTINSATIGFLGYVDAWNGNADVQWASGTDYSGYARILSGPGTITQNIAGHWAVTGLSISTPTRIEISRTFVRAQAGDFRIYPGHGQSPPIGGQIIVGAPSLVRTPGSIQSYKYDAQGLLRIKVDPLAVRTYYFYDRTGRKIGEVDGDGSVTEYKYDAADRLIATVAFANALSAGQIAALSDANGNPSTVTFASVKSQIGTSSSDRWGWNIYDKAGRLIQTIDAVGASTAFLYDGAGRLVKTTRSAYLLTHHLGANILDNYKAAPPTSFVQPSWDNSVDRTSFNYYDNDGLLIGSVDEEMFVTEYVYDNAGRKIESIGYANAASFAYQPIQSFNQALPGTWAQVRASIAATTGSDIRNYWLYDGRGLVGATVDGEGNVTRYYHNARGQVIQQIVGRKLNVDAYITAGAAQRTLSVLQGWYLGGHVGGHYEETTNYEYDSRGQMVVRQKALASDHTETTHYVYGSMGQLVSETTSETVSTETRTISNRYDAKGRLIATLGGVGSSALSAEMTQTQIDAIYATYGTRYVYDAADRIIQKITPDGSGTAGNRTLYYYDTDGQLRFEVHVLGELGEVTEYRYNALEDRTDRFVYGTRISIAGLLGGLVNAAILNAVDAVDNVELDSRDQWAYDNRGLVNAAYDPHYVTNPVAQNSTSYLINGFGESFEAHRYPSAGQYDRQTVGFYRRGLQYWDWQGLNGSATGSAQTTYGYDAFGRLASENTNNTDWRWRAYSYDRANRLVRDWNRLNQFADHRYDARSNLIETTDRTGRTTTYAYTPFNRLMTTTTADGVVSTVKKNAYGQTIQIADGEGRTTSYSYDKNGNLKTVTDAAGTTTSSYDNADRLIEVIDGRGVKTRYSYDAVGRMLTEVRDYGGLNVTTSYAYDAKGQVLTVTDARGTITQFTYDLKGQKTRTVQDVGGLGIVTDYVYRADGKVVRMIEASGFAAERRTDYDYDSMGRLIRETVDPNGLNLSTITHYDVNNNIVAVIDPRGVTTRFVYDLENRQILSVSEGGEIVETGYDAEGRVIWTLGYANRVLTTTVTGWSNEVAEATVRAALVADPARDRITRTFYDGDGRRAYVVDGEGYTTRFKYDGANNIIKTVAYAVPATFSNGSTTTSNNAFFGSIDSPPVTAAVTSFAYDNANRLTSTTDAEGYTESYQYDAVGNRTWLTNKSGGQTQYQYDNLGRLLWAHAHGAQTYNMNGAFVAGGYYTHFYGYDALGNVIWDIKGYGLPEQTTTTFEYDKLNRLTKKTLPQVQEYTPANGQDILSTPIETYQYDQRGNLILVTDPAGFKTFFYYDGDNRKVATITAVGQYQSWTYDGQGNVLTERTWGTLVSLPAAAGGVPPANPGGEYRETQFVYDRKGQLIERRITGIRVGSWNGSAYADGVQTLVVGSVYDAFGNVIQSIDANGQSSYLWYDRNGRRVQQLDAEGYVTTWTRDEDGNVLTEWRYATKYTGSPSSVSLPNSGADRVTTFTYDKMGRRLSETRLGVGSSTVAAGGALLGSASDAMIQFGYNGLGLLAFKTEANGDRTDYAYDNSGRLTWERGPAISDYNNVAVHQRTWMYYDGLGNLVRTDAQAIDGAGNYASGYSGATTRSTAYLYGPGGRLRSVTDANGQERIYQYDVRGNVGREQVNHARASGESLNSSISYSYDAVGRRISTLNHDYHGSSGWQWTIPTQQTTYNAYGEVAHTSLSGVLQEQFQYDLAGRVIKSNAGDGTWKLFGYDANGNATLTISSAGGNLTNHSVATALPLVGQEDVNATYTVFDKRNMAKQTVEEGRRLSASGALVNLTRSQDYNAFGEVISETDARGFTTNYSYNAMGRVTQKQSPFVNSTSESGVTTNIRPTENYAYDISGRLIATQDANGWWTTRHLLAGTGHSANGDDALVTKEFRPDSSVWQTRYDAYRDARTLIDGLGRTTSKIYDKLGQVTQITRPAGAAGALVESFSYDGLGRRLKSWNNHYGTAQAARTDYDALGRITAQIAQGGDTTTTAYVWDGAIVTTGLGTFGGWTTTTTHANGKTGIQKDDSFGREVWKQDLGGHQYVSSYDAAGRLVQTRETTTNAAWNMAWFNTAKRHTVSNAQGVTTFGYDANGNIVSERLVDGGTVWKDQAASYDALGRVTAWNDVGGANVQAASLGIQYDAKGNVRRKDIGYATAIGGAPTNIITDWYRYDALDRVVVDLGLLENGQIVRGVTNPLTNVDGGNSYAYNLAGERVSSVRSDLHQYSFNDPDAGLITGTVPTHYTTDYVYDGAGQLVEQGQTNQRVEFNPQQYYSPIITNLPRVVTTHTRDLLGRVTAEATPNQTHSKSYNAKSQVAVAVTVAGGVTTTSSFVFTDSAGLYLLGQHGSVTQTQGSSSQTSSYSYVWYDGAVRLQTSVTGTGAQSPGVTSNSIDSFGQVVGSTTTGASPGTMVNRFDAAGQGIVRTQSGGGGYSDIRYRMGGTELWHRSSRFALGGVNPEHSGQQYRVNSGDTLTSVALTIWGDASLWYKLAEANGLTADAELTEGQLLTIPPGVFRNHHNAVTFIPYDASAFAGLGEPSPAYPAPAAAKGAKCGGLGQVLMVVVAVAVTLLLTPGTGATLGQTVLGAAGGSIASQGVGLATGIQKKFDFKSLALAAVSAGVTKGIVGEWSPLGAAQEGTAKAIGNAAIRGAAGSAITNGIGVATGLQKRFDWAGVAAAGVGSGMASALGNAVGATSVVNDPSLRNIAASTLTNTAGAIANAATRSALTGRNFGDNLIAALPDVIGQTVGQAIAGAVRGQKLDYDTAALLDDDQVTGGGASGGALPMVSGAGGARFARMQSELDPARAFRARFGGAGTGNTASFQSDTVWRKGFLYDDNPARGKTDWQFARFTKERAEQEIEITIRFLHANGMKRGAALNYVQQAMDVAVKKGNQFSFAENKRLYESIRRGEVLLNVSNRPDTSQSESRAAREKDIVVSGSAKRASHIDTNVTVLGASDQPLRVAVNDNALAGLAPSWLASAKAVGSDFASSFFKGDFSKSTSVSADIGRFVGGFLPFADARDIGSAAIDVFQGRPGSFGNLGLAVVGFVPVVGDFAKAGLKGAVNAAERGALRTNYNVYEVLTEQSITGTGRSAHRISANKALYKDLQANPEIAQMLNRELGADVFSHMGSGSGRNLLNPPGAVWHHPIENPSVMRLLRTSEHNNPLLQPVLHPGPNRTGGFGTHFGGN